MCSVVGYLGPKRCKSFVLEGLARLEYRGYDSAGFACLNPEDNRLLYLKAPGKLENLTKELAGSPIDGFLGIGHTRWSTHGAASYENAHPHFDCEKKIAVVHNGILENHHTLRKQLIDDGHVFHSDTDTEVIAHLFESFLSQYGHMKPALLELVDKLEGAFAFISIAQDWPDVMILVRKRSPLCIGFGDGEMYAASDPLAFAAKTKNVLFMPDESFAIVSNQKVQLYDFSGKSLLVKIESVQVDCEGPEVISSDGSVVKKCGYEHYMLKEIYEQKNGIADTLDFLKTINSNIWDHLSLSVQQIQELDRICIVGCGTSWHAARIAQFFFEQLCGIPCSVFLASEFRYMPFFSSKNSLYIAVSQSGETADTLEAVRFINSQKLPTVAITNVASSSMVREADGFLLTQAGNEVSVASTKAFSTQLTALFWFANRLALQKGIIDVNQMEHAQEDLLVAAELLENSIENYKLNIVQGLAKKYGKYKKAIFLGRNISYPFAMEAALKLKEISYIFSQCYPAGELKHGPLALIDQETPVFVFSHQDPLLYQKIVANVQEVKARDGHVVVFAFEGQDELIELADLPFVIPRLNPLLGPLAMTGLVQFFVYQIAKELGRPIDKPRNLAKSVTVE